MVVAAMVSVIPLIYSCDKKNNPSNHFLYVIEENGLYGYIDSIGNRQIEPQYLYAQLFTDDRALVVVDTIYSERVDSVSFKIYGENIEKEPCLIARYGYIDTHGKFVISPNLYTSFFIKKEEVGKLNFKLIGWFAKLAFSSKRALCQDSLTWKYGYIDEEGNSVIPAIYESGRPFFQGRAVVLKQTSKSIGPNKMKGQYGIIDVNNKIIAKFEYYNITNYSSGRTIARKWEEIKNEDSQKMLVKNEDGEYDIEQLCLNGGWYDITLMLDRKGNVVDSLDSNRTYFGFSDGICIASNTWLRMINHVDCYEFIDTLGNTIKFMDGISEEQANELFRSGQIFSVVPDDAIIMDCNRFVDGLAGITMNNEVWVFVDKHLLIHGKGMEDTYDFIGTFSNKLAPVKKDGKWGYVNAALRKIIPCKYDSCDVNVGFLGKVYNFQGDSTISMYINRKDSIVWSYCESSGYNNNYDNRYSKKNVTEYGKWVYQEPNNKNTIIYLIVSGAIIVVISFITIIIRRKGK